MPLPPVDPSKVSASLPVRTRILRTIVDDVPFLFVVGVFALVAATSRLLFHVPGSLLITSSRRVIAPLSALYLGVAFIVLLVHAVVVRGASLRQARTWMETIRQLLAPDKLVAYTLLFIAIPLLIQVHLSFKSAIPMLHPFSWDQRLMEWDRLLHFGQHPFALLQPVLGRPRITKAIDVAYLAWGSVMWFTVTWQGWHGSRDTPGRSQFLLSFALCWILLGSVMAILMSSAGPVYFGAVTGATDPFEPLKTYLGEVAREYDLRALRIQGLLWTAHISPGNQVIRGIAAMPSLHVAMAVLLTLFGFTINRWVGWAYGLFAFVIFLGSVHLGWHYALDGYVATIGTLAIWWLSGKVVRAWRRRARHLWNDG